MSDISDYVTSVEQHSSIMGVMRAVSSSIKKGVPQQMFQQLTSDLKAYSEQLSKQIGVMEQRYGIKARINDSAFQPGSLTISLTTPSVCVVFDKADSEISSIYGFSFKQGFHISPHKEIEAYLSDPQSLMGIAVDVIKRDGKTLLFTASIDVAQAYIKLFIERTSTSQQIIQP